VTEKFDKSYFFIKKPNILKNKSKKTQIVLLNTGYPIDDYFKKILTRHNGNYNKIPTFTIDRLGQIYQHYDPLFRSQILDNINFDKHAITIALENVGWVEFDKINNQYLDWRGLLYNQPIIDKPWRQKKYWAEYTKEQFIALTKLIDYLCIEYSINKSFIGDNVLNNKPLIFKGIINRSNFSKNHYDLSPAFNFEELSKNINK
jgi:hypothetical protein